MVFICSHGAKAIICSNRHIMVFICSHGTIGIICSNRHKMVFICSHGTMVAGLIAGQTNNKSCTAGIAQNTKIVGKHRYYDCYI
jgi:hypothetical protein